MDPSLQALLTRLEQLSEQFRELRDGVQKAMLVAELDPEMALTRARKVLEYVVRDVYQHRINEPPGTRPLENLLQRLVKDGFFPDRLDAYANTIRKLGNVGTHTFGEKITVADVYQSLSQLSYVLEWYFEVEHPEAAGQQAAPTKPATVKLPEPPAEAVPGTPVAVIPKGLRSFDANDADFFLDLLPGPRDKDGLPESIRFWKHRIEERGEPTFTVGVIYGPSGCGKSSLVKAGLLPRLARHVLSVYVEATADDTEARLLKAAQAMFLLAGRNGPDRDDGHPAARCRAEQRPEGFRRPRPVRAMVARQAGRGGNGTGEGPPAVRWRTHPVCDDGAG